MAHLTAERIKRGIPRLERLIDEIRALNPEIITKRWGPEVQTLGTSIEATLTSVFGHDTVEYKRYEDAIRLDRGPLVVRTSGLYGNNEQQDMREAQRYFREGKEHSILLLRNAIKWLQDELTEQEQAVLPALLEAPAPTLSQDIFIVHGHDDGTREAVARFIEKIGYNAIILHEQANQGRTVIEKVEAHGDVGFAVVLLTPDDVGGKVGEEMRPRARQNVLLELGYFIGRLGRSRVCTLATSGEMELPTDFAGVVWETFDASGGWKAGLARELSAAGFDVDWNKVMNP